MAYRNIIQVGVRLITLVQGTTSDFWKGRRQPRQAGTRRARCFWQVQHHRRRSTQFFVPNPIHEQPPSSQGGFLLTSSTRRRLSRQRSPRSHSGRFPQLGQEHPDPYRRSHRCWNQACNSLGVWKVRLQPFALFGMAWHGTDIRL